jgi:hypothetical protein
LRNDALGTVVIITRTSRFLNTLAWIVPFLFLIGLRLVVQVTNPESRIRNRLVWAGSGLGVGGLVGTAVGGIIDIASHGLTAGLGTYIGALVGASIGGTLGAVEGPQIEQAKVPALIERGDAFRYLYQFRTQNSKVASPALVETLFDYIPSYDVNEDGRHWYAKADLDKSLRPPDAPAPTPGASDRRA